MNSHSIVMYNLREPRYSLSVLCGSVYERKRNKWKRRRLMKATKATKAKRSEVYKYVRHCTNTWKCLTHNSTKMKKVMKEKKNTKIILNQSTLAPFSCWKWNENVLYTYTSLNNRGSCGATTLRFAYCVWMCLCLSKTQVGRWSEYTLT